MPRAEFYRWQVRSFTVLLALDAVDRINEALHDPRVDSSGEHGGLLFGYSVDENTVEVTDFELMNSSHRRGIPYDLSPHERNKVGRRVQTLRRQTGPKPIGYFRTHLRPGLFLDQSDVMLITETSFDGRGFALAIRPNPQGKPEAGIFFPEENDIIDSRQPALKFPFDAEALRAQGPIEEPPELPAPDQSVNGFYRRGIRVKTLVSAFAYALAGAIIALATISEFHEHVQLSGAKFASKSADPQSSAARLSQAEILAAPPPVFSDEPVNSDDADNAAATTPLQHSPFESAERTEHDERKIPANTDDAPPFREAAIPVDEQRSAPLISPPAASTPPAPAAPSLAFATSLPAPVVTAPPMRSAVKVDVSVEPREESAFKRAARRVPSAMGHVPLLRRLPGLRRDREEPVVAAWPAGDLSPRLPAEVSRKVTEEVEVDVDASIDEEGAVKNAEIVRGDDPQLSALAEDAVRAAHWKPARSGDRSVPMNVVVHYRFSPGREP